MTTKILTGSKEEIAAGIAALTGNVREVIVFIDDFIDNAPVSPEVTGPEAEDIFTEMEPYMVSVGTIDDSREAIYGRLDDE